MDNGFLSFFNIKRWLLFLRLPYTPPQTENEIRGLLKNLEDYINNFDDGIDPLIKMALIHYQFESIHPFYERNGNRYVFISIPNFV